MNNQMELSFSAAAQNEAFARMVISAFLVQVNPKLSVVSEIQTAVSEAVTNSIVHAYSGDEGKVVMRARLDDTYVYIEIEDYGKGIGDIRQAMQPFFTTQPEQEQHPAELEPQAPAAADPALVEQLRAGFAWQYPAAALAGVPAKVSVTSIVHKAEQTTLERPGFLSKDGLTAAEMGTALHAFLEHADFAALAEAKAAGTLDEAIGAERDRQAAAQLTAPEIAAKLDAVRIRRFVQSEAFAKICAAQQVLRELAFITALPAAEVLAAQGSPAPDAAPEAQVLVQGIADLVLVYPDHLELLDYKTDRRKTAADFVRAYKPQLDLYALAVGKRFAPKPVTYKGIYSLELGRLIEV